MKRRSIWIVVCVFFLATVLAGQETLVRIRVENANAREAPDGDADIIEVVHKGEVYAVREDVPYWYGLALSDGRTGYVAKRLTELMLEEEEEESGSVEEEGIAELYTLPSPGNTFTLPGCSPTELSADWTVCPKEGSGGLNKLANVQKNRVSLACSYTVMTVAGLQEFNNLPRGVRTLPPSDQRRKYLEEMESRPVVVEAFVAMAKPGGKESTNCKSSERTDIHVELLATDTGDPKERRDEVFVSEVTPWFSESHSSWTIDALKLLASYKPGYKGTKQRAPAKVRIYGWLFFDNWHSGDGSIGTWRSTAWEIHPITRIEVWENGTWQVLD